MMIPDRSHLSIGEVLSVLQDEFPDITLSKIRFLESQGLVCPERTPSGYRRYYESDIKRLRWILSQQRDHYLPLKAIKKQLDIHDSDNVEKSMYKAEVFDADAGTNVSHDFAGNTQTEQSSFGNNASDQIHAYEGDPDITGKFHLLYALQQVEQAQQKLDQQHVVDHSTRHEQNGEIEQVDNLSINRIQGISDAHFTREELRQISGLENSQIDDLESYDLIHPHHFNDASFYDEYAIITAKLCYGFFDQGLDARHLRMYKLAADREVTVVTQLLMPLLQHRSGQSEVSEELQKLISLGGSLREVLIRQALQNLSRVKPFF